MFQMLFIGKINIQVITMLVVKGGDGHILSSSSDVHFLCCRVINHPDILNPVGLFAAAPA